MRPQNSSGDRDPALNICKYSQAGMQYSCTAWGGGGRNSAVMETLCNAAVLPTPPAAKIMHHRLLSNLIFTATQRRGLLLREGREGEGKRREGKGREVEGEDPGSCLHPLT